MKIVVSVLALSALVALVPCAPAGAKTPSVVQPDGSSVSTAAPGDVANFLESLSAGVDPTPRADAQPPRPEPLATTCTSDDDCPTGKLCCYPCGIDGCSFRCLTPVKGRCPLFV